MSGIALLALGVALASGPVNDSSASAMQASLQQQRESLQKQRDSLRHQPGSKQDNPVQNADFIAPIPALVEADCPALTEQEADALIEDVARKQSLQPALVRAVIRQESGFRPCAVSVKGAQGLMQLMPDTAAQLHVADPFNARQNVEAGTAFLKQLLERYKGDLRLALVAYNAGANRADDPNTQSYPAETQHYLANIFAELGLPSTATNFQGFDTEDSKQPSPDKSSVREESSTVTQQSH